MHNSTLCLFFVGISVLNVGAVLTIAEMIRKLYDKLENRLLEIVKRSFLTIHDDITNHTEIMSDIFDKPKKSKAPPKK